MISLAHLPFPHKHVTFSPDYCRCPRCGRAVQRHETKILHFWEPSLVVPTILVVSVGCYVCSEHAPGERWFTALPEELQGGGQYGPATKAAVVSLVERYKMPIVQAMDLAQRVLHLPLLDDSTILDWFRDEGLKARVAAFQERAAAEFSGQLALDEVYDGEYGQLKATDPIVGRELDHELVAGPITEEEVEAFCLRLKSWGIDPEVVVTDGSTLYPPVIARVWPRARHQRCVFHFMQQVNRDLGDAFWASYRAMPAPPKRSRGRPKKRGRPRKDREKRENRRSVRLARFLVFKRRERMTDAEEQRLDQALTLCPSLRDLRRLVEALHDLFGPDTTEPEQANTKRAAILQDPVFQSRPEFATVLRLLGDDDPFRRLTVYLDYENAEKTSNHVERENREFRKRQKSHYRLRSLESICSLLDLLLIRPRPHLRGERLRRKRTESTTGKEVAKAA